MMDQTSGSIVNFSSLAAHAGNANISIHYAAAKGVVRLLHSLYGLFLERFPATAAGYSTDGHQAAVKEINTIVIGLYESR